MCELMHFIKVAKGVKERMENLRIALKNPKSKEILKLSVTSTYSPVSY